MFGKSLQRGERRWRSFTVWMRRLRLDWNQHGWKRDPLRSAFSQSYFLDGTSLCNCFFLESREAWRFKDTPHGVCNGYECDLRHFSHGGEHLPIQERRAMIPESDEYVGGARAPRRRRGGTHQFKVQCMSCGYLLKNITVQNGLTSSLEPEARWGKCIRCKLKMA